MFKRLRFPFGRHSGTAQRLGLFLTIGSLSYFLYATHNYLRPGYLTHQDSGITQSRETSCQHLPSALYLSTQSGDSMTAMQKTSMDYKFERDLEGSFEDTTLYSIMRGSSQLSKSSSNEDKTKWAPVTWLEFAQLLCSTSAVTELTAGKQNVDEKRTGSGESFRSRLIDTLSIENAGFEAFFWEFAPVAPAAAATTPVTFVLVKSQNLEKVTQDSSPFQEHIAFATHEKRTTTTFTNLGGDSELLIPVSLKPANKAESQENRFAHIGNFINRGSREQVDDFLIAFGELLLKRIEKKGKKPLWVSTSG